MLKYSFMLRYSENTKEEAKALLENTEKEILYTYGLRYRNPATKDVPVSNEKALEIFKENSTCDVVEHENAIYLNAYGEMDLW